MDSEIKVGQTAIVGRITAKCVEQFNGKQRYCIEVTTESQYPSVFKFTTMDPTVYGDNEPVRQVGALVRVTAFVNGWKKTDYKDAQGVVHPLKFPRYDVSFRITQLVVLEPSVPASASAIPVEDVGDDMPY